jgi:hypothetical protein
MTTPASLRILDDDEDVAASERVQEDAQVFVRTLSAPAGLPWDQSRAAALEARLGAPLPLGEVVYQLKRLEPWAPGKPARFAAFYVRAQAIGERLSAQPVVDGEPVPIEFLSRAAQRRRSQRFIILASAGGLLSAVLLGSTLTALSARSQAATELESAEQLAALKLNQAKAVQRLKDQSRLLDGAGLKGRSLEAFLSDLAWAASAKTPDAKILGMRWEHGLMAFEVKGDAPPFSRLDRPVRKGEHAGAGGITLWGVGPASDTGGLREQTAHGGSGSQ